MIVYIHRIIITSSVLSSTNKIHTRTEPNQQIRPNQSGPSLLFFFFVATTAALTDIILQAKKKKENNT